MGWSRIDDNFPRHPRVAKVGPLAQCMQVHALCYCNQNLTDGFVPLSVAATLLDLSGIGVGLTDVEDGVGQAVPATWQYVVKLLVDAGMWTEVKDGFRIRDYLDYQPSRKAILGKREKERLKKGVQRRKGRAAIQRDSSGRFSSSAQMSPGDSPEMSPPSTVPLTVPYGSNGKGVSQGVSPRESPDLSPGDSPKTRMSPVDSPELSPGKLPEMSPGESPATQPQPQEEKEIHISTDVEIWRSRQNASPKHDALWSALLEACGIDPRAKLSAAERGAYNKATKGMREREATPDDIRQVAAAYRVVWPDATLTPSALDRRWSEVIAKVNAPQVSRDDLEIARWIQSRQGQQP